MLSELTAIWSGYAVAEVNGKFPLLLQSFAATEKVATGVDAVVDAVAHVAVVQRVRNVVAVGAATHIHEQVKSAFLVHASPVEIELKLFFESNQKFFVKLTWRAATVNLSTSSSTKVSRLAL